MWSFSFAPLLTEILSLIISTLDVVSISASSSERSDVSYTMIPSLSIAVTHD
jgi:hypothetical protein